MAKVAMETVDAVRRRLEVELPADEVIAEMDRAYDQLRRKANVRGFRQGRAPRSVLERMYGDQICADVFGDLIRRSFVDAIKEQEIEPVGEPEILTESAEPGAPLRYSANVEVKPNVVVEAYSGLEVERHLKAVTEADVAQFLESLRESCARLLPLTERTRVAAGDIATVDYDARIADRSVGHGHDRMMEAGGDDSYSLAQCLVGLERCVDATAAIDYPADYSSQELAGQHVSFRIRVKAIATKELPELNDEFAKEQSGSDTVEELRDRVRKQLEASAEQEADAGVRSALIDRLVQGNEFEVPGAMVERRTVALADEVLESLGPRRPPVSREAEFRSGLQKDLAPRARDQVKAGLILEAISSQEKLEISGSELEDQIERMAKQAGREQERVRAYYGEPRARDGLKSRLLQDRALDLLVERAKIRAIESESGVAGEAGKR